MQWRRQKRVTHVIGSSNHVLLFARYQDAPPGEEDEEDGLKNGYLKGQENGTNSRPFDRNGQTSYRPRKTGSGTTTTSGYTSASSKSRRDDSTGSPSQPKIIFNEEEYTRITTPRQDVLFKKGYLSQKKPWTSTASTSATPSTTESQSASHSTAGRDGSETTEDQQLLDSGAGEYSSVIEPAAQLGYGTFYDHASGYYYEYPVMLVGPPMPEQMEPNCLAAMSCGPVPLRPIEWVNPAFVPKIDGQQFCYTDYQSAQGVDCAAMVDAQGMMVTAENTNLNGNESYAESASCSGSIAGEDTLEQTEENTEELPVNEVQDNYNGGAYIEPPTLVPPMHITPVVQPLPQPYMYPGHYMFGPSLVNVNGVTIQSGPMVRYNDVMAPTTPMTCAKWRRKKRKRKQKRPPVPGNTEDEEEEEYSSEWENGSTRQPWTESSSTTTTRPLNPECQEFQLRSNVDSQSPNVESSTPHENSLMETNLNLPSLEISTLQTSQNSHEDKAATVSMTNMLNDCPINGDNSKRLTESSSGFPQEPSAKETDGGTIEPRGASIKDEPNFHDSSKSSNQHNNSHDHTINVPNSPSTENLTNHLNHHLHNHQNSTKVQQLANIQNSPISQKSTNIHHQKSSKLSNSQKSPKKSSSGKKSNKSSNIQKSSPSSIENSKIENSTNIQNSNIQNSLNDQIDEILPIDHQNSLNICNSSNTKTDDDEQLSREIINLKIRINGIRPTKAIVEATTPQDEKPCSRAASPEINCTITPINAETQRLPEIYESLVTRPIVPPRRKYSAKNSKFVREPTPGPDLTDEFDLEKEKKIDDNQMHNGSLNCERLDDSQIVQTNDDNINERVKFEEKEEEKIQPLENKVNRPITEAVTEWLRKADSQDLFVTTTGLESETDSDDIDDNEEHDESDEVNDENLTRKPPKNLQGNPIPALSSKGYVNNELLIRLANCGDFATTNKKIREQLKSLTKSSSLISRRMKNSRGKFNKTSDHNGNIKLCNSVKVNNLMFVGDCDFTKEDSDAGMRVALNSRTNDDEVKKIQCDKRIPTEDPTIVKTFEKGEIVVSIEGKLLQDKKFHYEPSKCFQNEQSERFEKDKMTNEKNDDGKKCNDNDDDDEEMEIEEPDVLDCWEAEIVEPILKHSNSLNQEKIEKEEDDLDPEVEHVKNDKLIKESVTSDISVINNEKTNSGNVPNSPASLQSEEIPIFMSTKQKIPIDEAFEVYESCYNGNQYITLDPRFRRQSKIGHEDGPIPCKAVCCNIQ
ncbi:homeobox protein 2-like isoform X2 [Leptopilina heterotoma]|uniref:homeobox protein 2-like isoform X2 n=1 Tax=Leptopilina heterotoma TaxID=63436 RepID=UPI001CA99E0A|nr:homeobox protein 2-like isoform X2 [Leptopilina heterotoma]